MSTLFRCGPCRRNQSAASDWTFWTTLAMPRLDNLPIPLQLSVVTAGMQIHQILASNSNARLERDQESGLAGIAHEWAIRSETLFNASPLSVLDFKVGRARGRSMCEAEENEEHHEGVEAGPAQSGRRASRRQRIGGQTGTRAMRPGFGTSRAADVGDNAYISGSWNIWPEDSVGEGGTSRRRRRLSLHLGIDDDEDEGAPTGEEREFRRRRTAEILESGQIKQDGAREVHVPLPFEPVGR